MKVTKIEAWATPNGHHTRLTRYYTNPDVEHIVWLHPNEVSTSLLIDDMHQASKQGIHHRVRP